MPRSCFAPFMNGCGTPSGSVDEIIEYHQASRGKPRIAGSNRGCCQHEAYSELMQGQQVCPVIYPMRRQGVVPAMPREEYKWFFPWSDDIDCDGPKTGINLLGTEQFSASIQPCPPYQCGFHIYPIQRFSARGRRFHQWPLEAEFYPPTRSALG